MSIEAMKQALRAYETTHMMRDVDSSHLMKEISAMRALRQAIEQAEAQEPVAWLYQNSNTEHKYLVWEKQIGGRNWQPLYTAPLGKEWVGLTDDEMFNAIQSIDNTAVRLPPGFKLFACAIEAKLKEKNNGN